MIGSKPQSWTLFALLAVAVLATDVEAQTRLTALPIGPQPPVVDPTQMVLNPATGKLYIMGYGGVVAVVDSASGRILTHIANTNSAQNGMFVNPTANRIYLLNGTLQVIDGVSDTLVQTVQAPPIPNTGPGAPFFGTGDYNPITNRFYLVEWYQDFTSGNYMLELMVLDGTTLARIAVVLGGPGTLPGYFPGRIVVNSTNNTFYGFFNDGNGPTYYWLWDGHTNAQLGGSSCAGTQCTGLIRGIAPTFVVNPADNRVWVTSGCTPPSTMVGGNTGGGGVTAFPVQSCITRVDGSIEPNLAYVPSTIVFGGFVGTGFDPASGRLVGYGNCLPITQTPPEATFNTVCLGPQSGDTGPSLMPVVFDPANPSQLIAVNLTGAQLPPNFTNGVSCGLGYFNLLGSDPALGNSYWGMQDCTGTHNANLTIGHTNFGGTPSATLPPSLTSQWVANLPSAFIGNMAVTGPFSDMTIDPATHRAFFLDAGESYLATFDPAVHALTSLALGNWPAGLAVNSATNTIFVGDAKSGTLNSFSGTTNAAVPQVPVGAGPFVAVNSSTNQVVVAGPSPLATDPNQVQGAILANGASNSLIMHLPAAATTALAVNSVTNMAYFADTAEWYAVSLQTGQRVFIGSDLSGTGTDVCIITGLDVNSAANRVYVTGKCQTNGQTLAVFDGATNRMIQQVSFGAFITAGSNFGFGRVAVNPTSGKVYVENIRLKTLFTGATQQDPATEVFDGGTLAHLTTIASIAGPMAVNAATNVVYICISACFGYDSVTDTSVGHFGNAITSIAVNQSADTVYVTGDLDLFGNPAPGMVTVYQGFPGTFAVSGTVLNGGVGLSGVSVSISGLAGVGPATTDASGKFTLIHVPAGTYTLTPTAPSFAFTPATQSVTVANANVTGVTFSAAPTFTISGQVVDSGGIGLPGMAVKGPLGSVVTDANGQFTLAGYVSGTYSIAPVTPAFQYTPASTSVAVASANVTGVSFTALPTFNITGSVVDSNGVGVAGITIVSQTGVIATAVASTSGAYVLPGFPAGTYTIAPTTPGFIYGPATQTVKVAKTDFTGVNFTVIPSVVIKSYTLSPYTTVGAGVVTNGTVTINQLAPAGGVVITLSASDAKPAKFPSSVTVPAGQSSVTFSVQGNGVSATTTTTLIASYAGPLAWQPTSANTVLTVSPTDTLRVTSATWSKSTQGLQVAATSTNAQAIIAVLNANGNVPLGTMTNLGNGSYTFQLTIASISSVNIKSNLGGSTGQGVGMIP